MVVVGIDGGRASKGPPEFVPPGGRDVIQMLFTVIGEELVF